MAFFRVFTNENMKVASGTCHYHILPSSSEHTNILIFRSILFSIIISFHSFFQFVRIKHNCVCPVNPLRFVDLVIGDIPKEVGVPIVFHSKIEILEWNAKVPNYVEFVFIFVDKTLSQNGAILLFHLNDM
jgi:hypothetical protein